MYENYMYSEYKALHLHINIYQTKKYYYSLFAGFQ